MAPVGQGGRVKVKAIKSFVGKGPNGIKYRQEAGDVFDLPEGTDWIKAGLVAPVDRQESVEPGGPAETGELELAATEPAETAVKPKGTRKKRG